MSFNFPPDYYEPNIEEPEGERYELAYEPVVYRVRGLDRKLKPCDLYICAACATHYDADSKTRISEGRRQEFDLTICDDCQREF